MRKKKEGDTESSYVADLGDKKRALVGRPGRFKTPRLSMLAAAAMLVISSTVPNVCCTLCS